jgi:hypothetical protein
MRFWYDTNNTAIILRLFIEEEKSLKIIEFETEENISPLLQSFDSPNDFYEMLNRLNYVIKFFTNKEKRNED